MPSQMSHLPCLQARRALVRSAAATEGNVSHIVMLISVCASRWHVLEQVVAELSDLLPKQEHIAPILAQVCKYCVSELGSLELPQTLLHKVLCGQSPAQYTALAKRHIGGVSFVAAFLTDVSSRCASVVWHLRTARKGFPVGLSSTVFL
jgi:hypothetical protein